MFSCVASPVEALSRDFDASRLTASQAVAALRELAAIRNVIDGLISAVGAQIEESGAHKMRGERNAAAFVARELGERVGDVREMLDASSKVRLLPAVDAAVRDGKLSARRTKMIAGVAAVNPDATERLLQAASDGMQTLRDECINARAEVEDPGDRPNRQRKLRQFRTWTDDDGMVAGRFRLTPEVGGQFLATLDKETQRLFRSRRSGQDHEPREAYAADALVNLVMGEPKAKKGADIRMHLVLDYQVLRRGWAQAGETCEIPGRRAGRRHVGPFSVGERVPHRRDQEGQGHHDRRTPRPAHTRGGRDRARRAGPRMQHHRLRSTRLPRTRPPSRLRQGRSDRAHPTRTGNAPCDHRPESRARRTLPHRPLTTSTRPCAP